jgi:hypothetical protein
MTINIGLFDSVSFLLFSLVLFFLSVISKRLGEVMGLRKYYYLYYLGIFCTLFGSMIMALSYGVLLETKLLGYVFFSIGMTLGLIASIRYWGWLIIESFRG